MLSLTLGKSFTLVSTVNNFKSQHLFIWPQRGYRFRLVSLLAQQFLKTVHSFNNNTSQSRCLSLQIPTPLPITGNPYPATNPYPTTYHINSLIRCISLHIPISLHITAYPYPSAYHCKTLCVFKSLQTLSCCISLKCLSLILIILAISPDLNSLVSQLFHNFHATVFS